MANTLALAAAGRLKQKLEEILPGRVEDVRIFGSYARGTAREGSDLDLLVLLDRDDDPEVRKTVCLTAYRSSVELGWPFVITPLIMSSEHFQQLIRQERLLAMDILREGIPI